MPHIDYGSTIANLTLNSGEKAKAKRQISNQLRNTWIGDVAHGQSKRRAHLTPMP